MATLLANDRLIWVETATPGTYICVGGQCNFSKKRSRSKIPTANKTSNWEVERAGWSNGSANLDLIPDLPDAGYARFEALCKAEPQVPFNIQQRKGGTSGNGTTDVIFACSVTCGDFDDEAPMNGVVGTKAAFLYATAPTVDELK